MSLGLPVSRLIKVDVDLAPLAAQAPNLNSLVIVGDSDVIDVQTRIMSFGSITEVAALFGTSAPEYLAALLYFDQVPSPTQLYIGRWAQAATHGLLIGGVLSATQQALANFTAVTNGGFHIAIDGGSSTNVTGINLSAVTNLNGVATAINTALAAATLAATVSWNGQQFVWQSTATGAASAVSFLTAPTAGTNLAPLMNATAILGARAVGGIVAETAVAAVAILDGIGTSFYGIAFASTHIVDADHLAIAAFVEAAAPKHLYGISTNEAGSLDPASTTDIGYLVKAANYNQTTVQYNSAGLYAVVSLLARILTTNFNANNSMITLMWKQEPGVTAEFLTSSQADALKAKNINVFVNYDNATAIIQYGTVASGLYIDEVLGVAWQKFRIQTDLYNALYTNPTKIPQTDAGMAQLATVIEGALSAGVNNGLIGPGTWTNGGFGQLKTGDFLASGFYVYTPPISLQSPSDRAARKSVAYQVAAKLAGAVHEVDVLMIINR
jgi:hypothetical protein